jgi:hypothetical protein
VFDGGTARAVASPRVADSPAMPAAAAATDRPSIARRVGPCVIDEEALISAFTASTTFEASPLFIGFDSID